MYQSGLEIFLSENLSTYRGRSLGLLANQASVVGYNHALGLIDQVLPGQVKALFNPQHGWAGEKQDNMVESEHSQDSGRPVYSLYGQTRRPSKSMFEGLEVLLVDLPDIGTRVYTFAQTMSMCLEEANGLEVVVLDRPNPIGGLEIEGNLLEDDCHSFVGLHPSPMRHGLTLGELALYFNSRLANPARLTIIPCRGWQRHMYFTDTNQPWIMPSPNMPTPETAWVYPGQVIWEGTNISEGRGTTRPFQLFGAPFINPVILAKKAATLNLPGVTFRPVSFQPCFHKWSGEVCGGLEIHPLDRSFKPYLTSLSLLKLILDFWPNDFKLKEPPYEYENERRPLDLILGSHSLFESLSACSSVLELANSWQPDLLAWQKERSGYLIYP